MTISRTKLTGTITCICNPFDSTTGMNPPRANDPNPFARATTTSRLFGGMFAAAARRESADPGDTSAQSSGTGGSDIDNANPPLAPFAGLPAGMDLLINPAVMSQIAGFTGTDNYETSPYNDSNTQEQNYVAYDAVMSAGETAPDSNYTNYEPDINEPEINPASFQAMDPDWSFGDGGIADNPYTTSLVEKYFAEWKANEGDGDTQPTREQVETIVQAAAHYAMYGNAGDFANYEQMVYEFVKTAIDNGMDANGEFPVQNEQPASGDYNSDNTQNADYNPDTDQGSYQEIANVNSPNSNSQKALKAFAEAERKAQEEAARQAWLKNPLTPATSSIALTQTELKISTLNIKKVPDSKFAKKVELANKISEENAKLQGVTYTDEQKAIRKDFITLVESLKEIIKENRNKLLPDDLNKLRSIVTQRIVSEMKDRIKYSKDNTDLFNYQQFDYATNTFIGPLKMDCSGFTTCIMHIMGDSPVDKPYAQDQRGYKFRDKYQAQSTNQLGPSNQGNNIDLFNFSEGKVVTKTDIVKMFDTNNVEALKKLEGKYFYWNDRQSPHTEFTTYSHTGIIGGYDEITKKLIIYDCNINPDTKQNGPGFREFARDDINNFFKHFDILELNK